MSIDRRVSDLDVQRLEGLHKRANRKREIRLAALIVPAVIFILISFAVPIVNFLLYSIENSEVPNILTRTVEVLESWNKEGLPPDAAYEALTQDLKSAQGSVDLTKLARRLNYHEAGYRTLILKTARNIQTKEQESYKQHLIATDARWGDRQIWATIAQQSNIVTPFYLLASLDLKRNVEGNIVRVPEERAIYLGIFERTFWMSFIITAICLLLGFPLAYVLVNLSTRVANWALLLVLLPFWTSLLVRTLAWLILLQTHGPINQVLQGVGLTDNPVQLAGTRFAVVVAMVYILLPFMILPIYSVMRNIPASHMRAAISLGANRVVAFWTVYAPQTKPGVGAGILLVSILALGFYITPKLVGGADDQMISYFVAFYTNQSVNWGMAAALGTWLLVFAMGLSLLINRFVRIEKARF